MKCRKPVSRFRFGLIFILSQAIFLNSYSQTQICSPDALTAKYWQYRKNLNEHFMLIDRSPSGCVNDGIGQLGIGSCDFSKAGYSLPATSINIAKDGHDGLVNKGRGIEDDPNDPNDIPNPWEDLPCAGAEGISWDHSKHNFLDMGSETPHQMGWYWVTLATEYELLRRNGQNEEAQRTLEELFLGLQAYRRLDMQAQCMVKKRYDEITEFFEVEECKDYDDPPVKCHLCGEKYRLNHSGDQGEDEDHPNFDSHCQEECDFTPQLDGYSGFFLREDATQGLEILHDDSQEKYNIDLVASDFAMSLAPPCSTTFSQPCYLVHRQDFMSQDGMTGLLIGLAMIKRFIPENAEVTTCNGNQEILMLMNNLLYPGGGNLTPNQAFFEDLLCAAPCEGPCQIQDGYLENNTSSLGWPIFNCSNTPRWQGQGWETNSAGDNRVFNGLDYMALYNIYMLHYNQTPTGYYNPERAPGNAAFGADRISGPNLLCIDQTAYYEAQPLYTTPYNHETQPLIIQDIQWESSNNFQIFEPNDNGTDIKAIGNNAPSFVGINFKEERKIPQYETNGTPHDILYWGENGWYWGPAYTYDYCDVYMTKPVSINAPQLTIETSFDHCNHLYEFHAVGMDTESTTYLWKLEIYSSAGSTTVFMTGRDKQLTWPFPGGNSGGMVVITLTITNECGSSEVHTARSYACQTGYNMVIAPNPADSHVYISFADSYTITQEGIEIRIVNTGSGTLQATGRIYSDGEAINIASLPEGTYSVQATLNNNTNLNAPLIISRQ